MAEIEAAGTGGTPKDLIINATAPVEIVAAPGEGGGPRRPTFDILGYTGAAMQLAGFYTPVIVDLSGLQPERQEIPALRDHDAGRIVGQTSGVTVDGDGVRLVGGLTGVRVQADGTVTGDNAEARDIAVQSQDGFRWQASIGATIVRQESVKAGESARVNGREVAGPLLIAREARLREISFVALGADGATSATVAASQSPNGSQGQRGTTMFEQWLEAKGQNPASLDDAQKTAWRSIYDAEQSMAQARAGKSGSGNPDGVQAEGIKSLDDSLAAIEARQQTHGAINAMATRFCTERPALIADIRALATAAIEGGSTVDQFELAARRTMGTITAPGITVRGGGRKKADDKTLIAAICRNAGLANLEAAFKPEVLEASHDHFPHGVGLVELLQIAARENGHTDYLTKSNPAALLRAAFTPERSIAASGGFSTFSLSGILSNVANKFLLDAFNYVPSGWRRVASIRPVPDFKTYTSYSLTGDLDFEEIGPTGEIKHGTIGEESYSNRAKSYGKMLAITREDIINDDLNAFSRLPRRIGRGAATKLNKVFWSTFMTAASTFFTSGRGNYISGSTTVLSSEGLRQADAAFLKQTDPNGEPMGVMPRLLVVPPDLKHTAEELMAASAINTGGSSTSDKVPNTNIWRAKFEVVMSEYLSNSTYTGYSTTAWYLLADPMDVPVIEVCFLNGRDTPMVDSADADFNTPGVQMRGIFDFGVAMQEYRGGVMSKGAS